MNTVKLHHEPPAASNHNGFKHENSQDFNKSIEWYTPPYILNALGHFDLDPAAAETTKIAQTNFTIKDDGIGLAEYGLIHLMAPKPNLA